MAEIFHLDAVGLAPAQSILKIKALYDKGYQGALTVGLDDQSVVPGVAAYLQAKGLQTQTYERHKLWMVLGHEPDCPEILVWYGPEGWGATLEDLPEDLLEEVPALDTLVTNVVPDHSPLKFLANDDHESPEVVLGQPDPGGLNVLVGSQFMGRGDENLGAGLAISFFEALVTLAQPPQILVFYNSGVYLTTRESTIVEVLRDLEVRGAVVISSGLCLKTLGLTSQLKVGRSGSMDEIIKAQLQAGPVIRM